MNISDYLSVLRRGWLLIVALVVVGAVAGFAAAAAQTPQYTAAAESYVSTGSVASLNDLSVGSTYTQTVAANLAEIGTTAYVMRDVITKLGLKTTTPAQLAEQVTVTATTGGSVLDIVTTDSSASRSAAIANAVAARLATAATSLTPDTAGGKNPLKVTLVDPAVTPASATTPKVPLDVAIGALLGLVLALLALILRELLGTKLRDVEDAASVTDLPLLGATMRSRNGKTSPILTAKLAHTPRAESFRTIRSNLAFLDVDGRARSIVVTSSVSGEGKSTSVVNLAMTFADLGERVILVDADLRRPRVADYLGLDGDFGLTDVLIGRASLDEAVQQWGSKGLAVLPAGAIPPNPNEMLQSAAMRRLIGDLQDRYDTVLFDAPPLLPVSDAAVLARQTSGAVLIAAAGTVQRTELAASVARLAQAQARVLGLVVTMLPARGSDARMYGQRGYASEDGLDDARLRRTATTTAQAGALR